MARVTRPALLSPQHAPGIHTGSTSVHVHVHGQQANRHLRLSSTTGTSSAAAAAEQACNMLQTLCHRCLRFWGVLGVGGCCSKECAELTRVRCDGTACFGRCPRQQRADKACVQECCAVSCGLRPHSCPDWVTPCCSLVCLLCYAVMCRVCRTLKSILTMTQAPHQHPGLQQHCSWACRWVAHPQALPARHRQGPLLLPACPAHTCSTCGQAWSHNSSSSSRRSLGLHSQAWASTGRWVVARSSSSSRSTSTFPYLVGP